MQLYLILLIFGFLGSSVVSAATTVDEPLPLFATASSSLRKHGASNPKEAPSYERSSLYVIGERQKLKARPY